MSNPYEVGDWVQWSTPEQIKQGEVTVSSGPSVVVKWLGGGEQVFPVIEGYHHPYGGQSYRLERIPRPRGASRIEREQRTGRMSVARAAALLGTDPKRIRTMLRGGKLRGVQTDGKWTGVNAEDVRKLERG